MKLLQTLKTPMAFNPFDTTGATTTGTALDLLTGGAAGTVSGGGAPVSEVGCILITGNVAANMTAMKIQESSDDGVGDAYADITGASFTAPTAASGDNKVYSCFLPVGGTRKRYLRVTATGGAGATLLGGVWLVVSGTSPNSDTERGTAQTLFPTA